MRLCIFEDAGVANLEPLTLTRPAFDLWLGASTQLERFQRLFPADEVGVLVRPPLADLCRQNHADLAVNDAVWLRRGPVRFVNARWLPLSAAAETGAANEFGVLEEQVVNATVNEADIEEATPACLAARLAAWRRGRPALPAGGVLLNYLWDFVDHNADALAQDYLTWAVAKHGVGEGANFSVVGPRHHVLVDRAARVEPHVLFDSTRGPILIDRDAVVQAFSRLEGPCYVGPFAQILGAKLRGGSVGPHCRAGGEVESSIVLGWSNKYHDGFLGHSYVGEWVNMGAGAHTSDLRTDYGPITMPVNGAQVRSGRLKIGAYLGDHTRTSIGALLNTGTVVGPFGLLLAAGTLLPRQVPSFCRIAHGRVEERTDLGQMFSTAATAMKRRGREWTDTDAELYFGLYERTAAQRARVLRENEQHRLRRVV